MVLGRTLYRSTGADIISVIPPSFPIRRRNVNPICTSPMETKPESFASPEEGKALFEAYVAAEDEVQTILKEIDERLSRAEDRGQAERGASC